jgi:uncharacterized protein YcfJ
MNRKTRNIRATSLKGNAMKRMIVLALVVAMFLTPLMSTAQAFEPIRNRAGIAMKEDAPEGWRRRRVYRHVRRPRRGGSSSGAGIVGALIGGLIAGAIKSSQKPKTPTLYCDQYGNCWYR